MNSNARAFAWLPAEAAFTMNPTSLNLYPLRRLDEKERERQRLQSDLDKVRWERDEILKNADAQKG